MYMPLKMAIHNILSNKTRSMLTMLGIIIAVLSFVVMVSLVQGAMGSVTSAVSGLGVNEVSVSIQNDHDHPITLRDINTWMQTVPEFGEIGVRNRDYYINATYAANTSDRVVLFEVNSATFEEADFSLRAGRWIKDADIRNNSGVCVVNDPFARDVIGYLDCVGEEVMLAGTPYTIVGVLNKQNALDSALFSQNYCAYIPMGCLSLMKDEYDTSITLFGVLAGEGYTVGQAKDRMTAILDGRFHNDDKAYTIETAEQVGNTMSSVSLTLEFLLGGIALVALIVGGVGILNIMMVTVAERTHEIGIRKAVGAKRRSILMLFLMESVVLCLLGCLIGVILSYLLIYSLSGLLTGLDIVIAVKPGAVLLSAAFCVMVGVVFGLYPANKAAKMKPIDALRSQG